MLIIFIFVLFISIFALTILCLTLKQVWRNYKMFNNPDIIIDGKRVDTSPASPDSITSIDVTITSSCTSCGSNKNIPSNNEKIIAEIRTHHHRTGEVLHTGNVMVTTQTTLCEKCLNKIIIAYCKEIEKENDK